LVELRVPEDDRVELELHDGRRTDQGATRTASASRASDDERTDFARKWGRWVHTVLVGDALDLTTRQARDVSDEVDASAGDSLASANAQAGVDALPELGIGTRFV
jgi:hypothetical protein